MNILERLGYRMESNSYVKNIDEFAITLFPQGEKFIRRIIFQGRVIDIRKVDLMNLENDKAFYEVLRQKKLSTQPIPKEIKMERVLGRRKEVVKPFRGEVNEVKK